MPSDGYKRHNVVLKLRPGWSIAALPVTVTKEDRYGSLLNLYPYFFDNLTGQYYGVDRAKGLPDTLKIGTPMWLFYSRDRQLLPSDKLLLSGYVEKNENCPHAMRDRVLDWNFKIDRALAGKCPEFMEPEVAATADGQRKKAQLIDIWKVKSKITMFFAGSTSNETPPKGVSLKRYDGKDNRGNDIWTDIGKYDQMEPGVGYACYLDPVLVKHGKLWLNRLDEFN